MKSHGYKKFILDHCAFIKKLGDDDFTILFLYIDDMLILGQDIAKIVNLKKNLSKFFSLKDLGPAKNILGMSIKRDRETKRL